jgi:hypothetical protein
MRGFFQVHVGGIFQANDVQPVADYRGVGGAGLDALGAGVAQFAGKGGRACQFKVAFHGNFSSCWRFLLT